MSKRFKQIILHAGMPKTGTSTIQMFLKNNVKNLESKYKILYPVIENDPRPFKENHSIWITSLFSENGYKTPVNINFGFNSVAKLKERNDKTYQELQKLFDSSNSDRLMISAEGISTIDEQGIFKMFDWLNSLADEIKMILCVRHPNDGISSETQQKIKTGKTIEALTDNPKISLNRKVLKCALEVIGKSNIKVFDFYSAKKSKFGLLGNFLEIIDVSLPMDQSESKSTLNTSMSLEGTLLLSILNKYRPKYVEGKIGPKRFGKDLKFFISLKGAKFSVPDKVFEVVKPRIKDEIAWIEKQFGVEIKWAENKQVRLSGKDFKNEIKPIMKELGLSEDRLNQLLKQYYDGLVGEQKLIDPTSMLELKEMVLTISNFLNKQEVDRLQRKLKSIDSSDPLYNKTTQEISNLL